MWPKDNPDSWRCIHEFIDWFPDDEYWSKWKPMVRQVVSDLEARGLSEHFRIGQSMHDIIISTADHHRLTSEPYVTLEFYPEEHQVRVAYSCAYPGINEPGAKPRCAMQPDAEERVDMPLATSRVLHYLRRLWSESKGDVQVPDGLNDV